MFKYTNIKLGLIKVNDQFMFIERAIRGGVTQCSNRFAEGNHIYTGQKYDNTKDDEYLMYYDTNGLYASMMSQDKLQYKDLEWLSGVETNNFDVKQIGDDKKEGFFLQCDIEH